MRAIIECSSWMQNATLPGWYGLGTALETYYVERRRGHHPAGTVAGHARWPFFRTVIDNAQMILGKADLYIAEQYAALVPDTSVSVFGTIAQEHARARERCAASRKSANCWKTRWCCNAPSASATHTSIRSVIFRWNCCGGCLFDPDAPPTEALEDAILLSISGIAAGVKNTG